MQSRIKEVAASVKEVYGNEKNVYILELAGNDSLAALVKLIDDGKDWTILPVLTKTPDEFGDETYFIQPLSNIREYAKSKNSRLKILDAVKISEDEIWHTLITKVKPELIHRYGFYTPCIMCHAYVHAVRMILAKEFDVKTVITGERITHDKLKINQTRRTLMHFNDISYITGVGIKRPICMIDTNGIRDLLHKVKIYDRVGLSCKNSGKYNSGDINMIDDYCIDYLVPIISHFINTGCGTLDLVEFAQNRVFNRELKYETM